MKRNPARWIGSLPLVLKLTLTAVITTAIAVAVAVWLSFSSSRELLLTAAVDSMRESTSRKIERLRSSIDRGRQDSLLLAHSDAVQGMLRARANNGFDDETNTTEEGWRERLENAFAFMLESKGYQKIRLIALEDDGREIVRVDGPKRPGRNVVIRSEQELQAKGHRFYIDAARKLAAGQVYVSPITLNREHGGIEVPWRPTQRFVVPVFIAGIDRTVTANEAREATELAGKILYFDEVLTMSALAAAQSGDLKWEERYRENEHLLNQALRQAITLSDDPGEKALTRVDAANRALVEIELHSFDLVRAGRADEAVELLQGVQYANNKSKYAKGLETFLDILEESGSPSTAVAIVVINTDAQTLMDGLEAGDHFEVILANDKGGVLYHPDPNRAWGFEFGKNNGLDQEHPRAWRVLLDGQDDVCWDEKNQEVHVVGTVPLNEKGNRFLAVVATAREHDVLADVAGLRLNTAAVSLIAILLAGGLCAFSLRRLMRPILTLTEQADELSAGNTEVRLTASGSDEVGRLGGALANLVEKLQKRTEEAKQAKDYTENIIRSMLDMLMVVAPDGRIVTVNEATCKLLGYREDELIEQPASVLFSEEEEDTAHHIVSQEALPFKRTVLRRLVKDGSISNVEKLFRTKSSHTIPVLMSGSVMRGDDGTIRGIVCVAQDITERKQTEGRLREAKEAAESASESLKDTVEELGTFNRLAVGRELRMIELKQEINELLAAQGKAPRFEIVDEEVPA